MYVGIGQVSRIYASIEFKTTRKGARNTFQSKKVRAVEAYPENGQLIRRAYVRQCFRAAVRYLHQQCVRRRCVDRGCAR